MKNTSAGPASAHNRPYRSAAMPALDFSSIMQNIPTLSRVDLPAHEEVVPAKAVQPETAKAPADGLKALAEAVILQAMEDLWSKTHQKRSIEFFSGESFRQVADMAGLGVIDRLRLIRMLRKVDKRAFRSKHAKEVSRLIA